MPVPEANMEPYKLTPYRPGRASLESAHEASRNRRHLPRASQACQMCRAKKVRCNQQRPCSFCTRHKLACIYAEKVYGKSRTSLPMGLDRWRVDAEESGDEDNDIEQHREKSGPRAFQDNFRDLQHPGDSRASEIPVTESDQSENVEEGFPDHDSDIVGDINEHTTGTEFYGTSSNFVLLNQLFSHARLQASNDGSNRNGNSPASRSIGRNPTEDIPNDSPDPISQNSRLASARLSIINLLYNDEDANPPPRPKTPNVAGGGDSRVASNNSESNRPRSTQPSAVPSLISDKIESGHLRQKGRPRLGDHLAERRLEKEYVRLYFNNLHHLHPLLYMPEFTSRCEEQVWGTKSFAEPWRNRMHFLALYNIVVAVGALIAGPEVFQGYKDGLGIEPGPDDRVQSARSRSSLSLSKTYFQKSRTLLGDMFEVCSLESAQTLFLTSLYCQNALKPHSCYMYSGMAVRTALAIGLPSESMSRSTAARKAARRTWWCIYSHEIDMCCSSGRRDSLMKPGNYLVPLPKIRDQSPETAEIEEHNISMINEMVHFSVILRRASKQIYHDAKGLTLLQKSAIAVELDMLLEKWRSDLPPWLSLDSKSIREPEWASKQKLVLKLRYLNARILLHRPFLADSSSMEFGHNVQACLHAARQTIEIMYDAYANRHYFRTWWYNSTYTLYAGMILLYVILLNYTGVPGDDLLVDVEKSKEILLAMEEASVAQRSAKLMGEVLEVAKSYISQRQGSVPSPARDGVADFDAVMMDSDWSRVLFNSGSNRGDILATLIDPTILQDFATGNHFSTMNDMSPTSLSGPSYESPEQFEAGASAASGGMQWDIFGDPLSMMPGGTW